jgi:hypothetical protein
MSFGAEKATWFGVLGCAFSIACSDGQSPAASSSLGGSAGTSSSTPVGFSLGFGVYG